MIEDLIYKIIEERTDVNGSTNVWTEKIKEENGRLVYVGGLSIEEEIEEKCKEKGIEVSVERWEIFDNPSVTMYALSIAWIEDGKLHHYTDTLEVF